MLSRSGRSISVCITWKAVGFLDSLHISRLKKHQHASSNPVYHQHFYLVGHSFVFSSDWNNVFLIDRLFRWMLGRACSALVYSWRSGGGCNPSSRSKVKPWSRIGVMHPEYFFYLYLQKRRKLAHKKRKF